jgi:uncharacterized membrane protein YeaQ/YmgE (transglycosylase-associated protein family)
LYQGVLVGCSVDWLVNERESSGIAGNELAGLGGTLKARRLIRKRRAWIVDCREWRAKRPRRHNAADLL